MTSTLRGGGGYGKIKMFADEGEQGVTAFSDVRYSGVFFILSWSFFIFIGASAMERDALGSAFSQNWTIKVGGGKNILDVVG